MFPYTINSRSCSLHMMAVVLFAGTALAGCSGDDDSPSTAGMPPPSGGIALTAADLDGDWSTGCLLDDPDDIDSEYESASVTFTGNEILFTSDSFADAGCTESLDEDVELEGTFSLGGSITTSEGLSATEIDLEVAEEDSSEFVTVLDLVHISGSSLFFANGDFGELDDIVGEPRPDDLELDEPFQRQ